MRGIDTNWQTLEDKFHILDGVEKNGYFELTASQIKGVKEPRLMVKFDSAEDLPELFKNNHLGILPISSSAYKIGHFDLFEDFPPPSGAGVKHLSPPNLETISTTSITSEHQAISAMQAAGMLEDFLGVSSLKTTMHGRMSSGNFSFAISGRNISGKKLRTNISVSGSQIEIDAGLEGDKDFVIIEAKAVPHNDFLIRQLYYPFLTWKPKTSKQVRCVFMRYLSGTFHLYEYAFHDPFHYNSIELVKTGNYSLEKTEITKSDLEEAHAFGAINPLKPNPTAPFPQADKFEKVFAILELAEKGPVPLTSIASHFAFTMRQADYYFNAGKYINLLERVRDKGVNCVQWTTEAKTLLSGDPQMWKGQIAKYLLRFPVFNKIFGEAKVNGWSIPDKALARQILIDGNILNGGPMIDRRASSLIGWCRWLLAQISI